MTTVELSDRIDLTNNERQIFDLLQGALRESNLKTQLRVAGGWVRDKAPGTPKEDAYRRDLTINSLFYNLHTGLVEDHTGRGIDDLKCGRLITPLPAKATFMEDPLRVLRAIRFGAKFGFTLDEEMKETASSEEVRVALERKICRERIGNEIDMMITGNGPVSAVTHLSDSLRLRQSHHANFLPLVTLTVCRGLRTENKDFF